MTENPFENTLENSMDLGEEFDDPTGGKYAKMADLCGRLLILKVVKIDENFPVYESKTGETKPRAFVDVVVLDGGPFKEEDLPVELDNVWFDSGPLIDSMRKSFKNGSRIAARLRRFPRKDFVTKYPTPDAVEAAVANHELRESNTFWRLTPRTEADMVKIKAYVDSKKSNPFG